MQDTFKHYKLALNILRDIKDRWEEGRTLHNIGTFYLQQPNGNAVALASFLLAKEAFEQVQSPDHDITQTHIEDLCNKYPALLNTVQGNENQIVEQALRRGI